MLVAAFHDIVEEVLIVEGFFDILINGTGDGVEYFGNVIHLPTYATAQLCLISGKGVYCILYIGSSGL